MKKKDIRKRLKAIKFIGDSSHSLIMNTRHRLKYEKELDRLGFNYEAKESILLGTTMLVIQKPITTTWRIKVKLSKKLKKMIKENVQPEKKWITTRTSRCTWLMEYR